MPTHQFKVHPGLLHHTIDTDEGTVNVSKGYLPAATVGVMSGVMAALASYALKGRNRDVKSLRDMALNYGTKGAITGAAINEFRRRNSESYRNKDREAFDSVIKDNYKPKVNGTIAVVKHLAPLVNATLDTGYTDQVYGYENYLDDLTKESSVDIVNKAKIEKRLDQDAHDEAVAEIASSMIAPLAVAAMLGKQSPNTEPVRQFLAANAGGPDIMAAIDPDRKVGTRYYSWDEVKNKLGKSTFTPDEMGKIRQHGIIFQDRGDLSASTMAREIERGKLRGNVNPIWNRVPAGNIAKTIGAVNTGYAFLADADNSRADATAALQAIAHAPRLSEDVRSALNAIKRTKNVAGINHSAQGYYIASRALPALMPVLGRLWKKMTYAPVGEIAPS